MNRVPQAIRDHLEDALVSLGYSTNCLPGNRGGGRHPPHVRQFEQVCARMRCPMRNGIVPSFPEIARAVGARTHSTIIDAVRRAKARPDIGLISLGTNT